MNPAVGQDDVEQAVQALRDPGPADPHSLRVSLRTPRAVGRRRNVTRGAAPGKARMACSVDVGLLQGRR